MTTVKDIVSCVFDEERIKLVKGRYSLWLFLFYNIICIFVQADIIVSFFFFYSVRKDGVGGRTMATHFMYFLSVVKLVVVWVKFASRNKIHIELKTIFNNWKVGEHSWPSYKLWIILVDQKIQESFSTSYSHICSYTLISYISYICYLTDSSPRKTLSPESNKLQIKSTITHDDLRRTSYTSTKKRRKKKKGKNK